MANKTLYLDKSGCNFEHDDRLKTLSDINNHRITTIGYTVKGKDGNMYFLEFITSTKWNYRHYNKRTGEPLKKSVKELVKENCLYLDAEFKNSDGRWSNIELYQQIWSMNLDYTMSGVLEAVNYISADHYERIVFIDDMED